MSKALVVYQSKYGGAKVYAEWLKSKTGCDIAERREVTEAKLREYSCVIFGGGVYAGRIAGLSFVKKNSALLSGKRTAVFAVGATESSEELLKNLRNANFTSEMSGMPFFYCRGKFDLQKMKGLDKMIIRMVQKAKNNNDASENGGGTFAGDVSDWTDEKYLEPVLKFLAGI
ncbi:MAG TPA: hypothetical protein DEQ02_08430 [Ruminococcaceae bacterium]|nr:hypothetical protein [Oscillospiraceae bacterium]